MCIVLGITFYTFCVVPTLPGQKKRYAVLQSLDLICDSKVEQQLWLEKVSEDDIIFIDGVNFALSTAENIYNSQESSVFESFCSY